ncbi:hypothetical protein KR026_008674 [Drosophila bipectinata]|nr:hypothetical protein KR026_008674 [Drosophila bipectinata]
MFSYRLEMMVLLGQLCLLISGYPLGEDLSAGVHSAGLLGSYAGGLTGGEALSKLDFSSEVSSHEFGGVSDGDHLGSLGDHLSEDHFPADYSSGGGGEEYAEASEIHSHYEEHHEDDHKPVPGIDHGKGAFSYSTLYEFKDRDEHEVHQLQHQALEQQVEHQQAEMHHLESHDHDLGLGVGHLEELY